MSVKFLDGKNFINKYHKLKDMVCEVNESVRVR